MREINIGNQGFEDIIEHNDFYVDKTLFIKEWWENRDTVTLITRPRRFGKTLNMQMLDCFFSDRYAGKGERLFDGLAIWDEEYYRQLQGTYPVIFLTFANIKESAMDKAVYRICTTISRLFESVLYLQKSDRLEDFEKKRLYQYAESITEIEVPDSIRFLSDMLYKHTGKKVLIFLDEYDTPLQEAYVNGYWDQMSDFIRNLFNSTFKTNPSMERALLTGITRVSKESIFSDLNNPEVIITTSRKYETAFGFTENEVADALEEYGLSDKRDEVKDWYDGFTFGDRKDIYNPWSITNFLDKREFDTYWANTSSNRLISDLVAGNQEIQSSMVDLLDGNSITVELDDEEIAYSDLDESEDAIWNLMIASGYLKIESVIKNTDRLDGRLYKLSLTNGEVHRMFAGMIRRWFGRARRSSSEFVKSMISGDVKAMNEYMNDIALYSFSSFDVGTHPSDKQPERFYHGFVLGLLVNERERYIIRSNRESGLGRYDVCMYPKNHKDPGIVMEFKVLNDDEKSLSESADAALKQIKDRDYAADLVKTGVETIYEYGFAFSGRKVLIKKNER